MRIGGKGPALLRDAVGEESGRASRREGRRDDARAGDFQGGAWTLRSRARVAALETSSWERFGGLFGDEVVAVEVAK